jgi:glycosyltransferase involved in cell wall biosynthesis
MLTEAGVRRPRLLLLENSLHRTGAFTSALAIATSLRHTHEIEFLLPTTSTLHDVVVASGIVSHRLPMSELGRSWRKLLLYVPMLVINTLRLRYLLASRIIDGVIVNDYYNLLGVCIRLTGWRKPVLTMVRLLPSNQHPMMNKVWLTLGLLFTNRIVAVSHAVAKQLPIDPKVTVIFQPINFIENYPRSFLRHGVDDGHIRCLYPANYISGKGHGVALEAFLIAWRQAPMLRLRFVGSDMGLEKNRALKTNLMQRINQLGLQNVVTVDGSSPDIELEIKNSDIVLNFSQSESFSQTCAEASAFGRPIISTRCGGPEEIIDDNVTGLLVCIGDVSAMSAAILRMAYSQSLRQTFGEAGYISVRKKFSSPEFRLNFQKLWSSVC